MHQDMIRVVVRGYAVGTAFTIAVAWSLIGTTLWNVGASDPMMMAYFATAPVMLLAAGLSVAVRWVVHADPEGIELSTEPFPLPFAGWSLTRQQVAFVSIAERERDDEGLVNFGYRTRWTAWGGRRRVTWAVVLTDRSGRNRDLATEFHSTDAAKELADQIRRTMKL